MGVQQPLMLLALAMGLTLALVDAAAITPQCLDHAGNAADAVWTHKLGDNTRGWYTWSTNDGANPPRYFSSDPYTDANFPPTRQFSQFTPANTFHPYHRWLQYDDCGTGSAHARGLLSFFDGTVGGAPAAPAALHGLWITHSLPKYPELTNPVTWGPFGPGQHFLCVAFNNRAGANPVRVEPMPAGVPSGAAAVNIAHAEAELAFNFSPTTIGAAILAHLRLRLACTKDAHNFWRWTGGKEKMLNQLGGSSYPPAPAVLPGFYYSTFTGNGANVWHVVSKSNGHVADYWVEAVAPFIAAQGGGGQIAVKTWAKGFQMNSHKCCGRAPAVGGWPVAVVGQPMCGLTCTPGAVGAAFTTQMACPANSDVVNIDTWQVPNAIANWHAASAARPANPGGGAPFLAGTCDHSKFAISDPVGAWVCSGDLNRQGGKGRANLASRPKGNNMRGGGAICAPTVLTPVNTLIKALTHGKFECPHTPAVVAKLSANPVYYNFAEINTRNQRSAVRGLFRNSKGKGKPMPPPEKRKAEEELQPNNKRVEEDENADEDAVCPVAKFQVVNGDCSCH